MKKMSVWILCLPLASFASPQAAEVTATQIGSNIAIKSTGGPVTYKGIVNAKFGGNITDGCLPADGQPIARELNGLFYYGIHPQGKSLYSVRGWPFRESMVRSCTLTLVSQKHDEVVVQADVDLTGTFKVDDAETPEIQAQMAQKIKPQAYKADVVKIKRTITFKSDRFIEKDELNWLYLDAPLATLYFGCTFLPGTFENPVRLIKDGKSFDHNLAGSTSTAMPDEVTFPYSARNFLKNGYTVTVTPLKLSFDTSTSRTYFYEYPWQQDWNQVSDIVYHLNKDTNEHLTATHEVVFARATPKEQPPLVTFVTPCFGQRWMDEDKEVAHYKVGGKLKLAVKAVNADGTPVDDKDIAWEFRVNRWWRTTPIKLTGNNLDFRIAPTTNAEDIAASKGKALLGIFKVTVTGNNGAKTVETLAVLLGKLESPTGQKDQKT